MNGKSKQKLYVIKSIFMASIIGKPSFGTTDGTKTTFLKIIFKPFEALWVLFYLFFGGGQVAAFFVIGLCGKERGTPKQKIFKIKL